MPEHWRELAPGLVQGRRTGFVFRTGDRRKVLAAVRQQSVERNDYCDGPFDQLADNYARDTHLRQFLEKWNPSLKGRIDDFGNFIDSPTPTRVAIAPYATYGNEAEALQRQPLTAHAGIRGLFSPCPKCGMPRHSTPMSPPLPPPPSHPPPMPLQSGPRPRREDIGRCHLEPDHGNPQPVSDSGDCRIDLRHRRVGQDQPVGWHASRPRLAIAGWSCRSCSPFSASILLGIAIPAFAAAKAKAESTVLSMQAAGIFKGMMAYAGDHDGRLPQRLE